MRYYALAHRPAKVREVMNLLISYSLVQSAAYPPTADLDDYLHQLLADRNKTLERFAARDLEAAEQGRPRLVAEQTDWQPVTDLRDRLG